MLLLVFLLASFGVESFASAEPIIAAESVSEPGTARRSRLQAFDHWLWSETRIAGELDGEELLEADEVQPAPTLVAAAPEEVRARSWWDTDRLRLAIVLVSNPTRAPPHA